MIPRSYPKRFVVFGASGFIGRSLIESLQTRRIPVLAPLSSELNLLNRDSCTKITKNFEKGDHVIILAALSPYRDSSADLFEKNIRIAETIADAITKDVEHIVYVSSDAIYGSERRYVDDQMPPMPDTTYGLMHLKREIIFSQFKERLAVVRPTMVFGRNDPHQAYGPNRFIKTAANRGEISLFGKGEELRDYIELTELVRCLLDLSVMRFKGAINLVSGTSFNFLSLAEIVVSHFPKTEVKFLERTNRFYHRQYINPYISEILTWRPQTIDKVLATYLKEKNARI